MSWATDPRIHQVCASIVSEPEGTEDYDRADQLADRLAAYARRLGFNVMHENVDRAEPTSLDDR